MQEYFVAGFEIEFSLQSSPEGHNALLSLASSRLKKRAARHHDACTKIIALVLRAPPPEQALAGVVSNLSHRHQDCHHM